MARAICLGAGCGLHTSATAAEGIGRRGPELRRLRRRTTGEAECPGSRAGGRSELEACAKEMRSVKVKDQR
jgi:hypothetical protein